MVLRTESHNHVKPLISYSEIVAAPPDPGPVCAPWPGSLQESSSLDLWSAPGVDRQDLTQDLTLATLGWWLA